jgi:hypothetical protein
MFKLSVVATLVVLWTAQSSPGVLASSSSAEKEVKPTGACTITVYGITPTCTSGMTEDSCNAVAKKVGGTASWEKGKSCPKN